MRREARVLHTLCHENVAQLLNEGPDFFVFEFVPDTLFSYIVDHGPMSEETSMRALRQLLLAADAVQNAGFAHLDIKPENILFKPANGQIVLIDFGCAEAITTEDGGRRRIRGFRGSPGFSAPEVNSDQFYFPSGADVWSCGCVYFTMLNATPPFENTTTCPFYNWVNEKYYDEFWSTHEQYSFQQLSLDARGRFIKLLGPSLEDRPSVSESLIMTEV